MGSCGPVYQFRELAHGSRGVLIPGQQPRPQPGGKHRQADTRQCGHGSIQDTAPGGGRGGGAQARGTILAGLRLPLLPVIRMIAPDGGVMGQHVF